MPLQWLVSAAIGLIIKLALPQHAKGETTYLHQ
jgi:hypothetical protein